LCEVFGLEESYALVEGGGGDGGILENWGKKISAMIGGARTEEQLTRYLAARSVMGKSGCR